LTCVHRITGGEASYCFLQSNRFMDDRQTRGLVFQGALPGYPVRCDGRLLSTCLFRDEGMVEGGKGALSYCPHCKRRHRNGSTAKRLCEDWHSVKAVLKEMRDNRPGGKPFLENGTTLLPYRPDTPDLVRQLVWMRLKGAIVRRDRYTCQDCGESFGKNRRKVFDKGLRRGRGGYRWESLEVHHIVPRSRGGSDHPGNLKTLCPRCHRSYTSDLRSDSSEARKRESDLLSRMRKCEDEEPEWDPPTDY
jgi:5-methylcytosine-specific restriction endonuclease McrA